MAKVGFTCGVWDLLHPGHVEFIRDCRTYCDELYIGLKTGVEDQSDIKQKPIQTVYERYVQLLALEDVANIIPYESEKDLELILHFNEFDIRFVGTDYLEKPITGEDICSNKGIIIHYIERNHHLSTTELRTRIEKAK